MPHNCPGPVKSLHPTPAAKFLADSSPAPDAQAQLWSARLKQGCLCALLPARPPACMPGGGQCRCRASTACVAGSRRAAALANSAQTGAAARPLSFPLCPFISTAGAWRSATFRRGKGETVLRPLGWHGAALWELGTDLLMPPAKAPAWGKAAFCHRARLSHEGKGHWLCWKHAEGMSWWTVLSSG